MYKKQAWIQDFTLISGPFRVSVFIEKERGCRGFGERSESFMIIRNHLISLLINDVIFKMMLHSNLSYALPAMIVFSAV